MVIQFADSENQFAEVQRPAWSWPAQLRIVCDDSYSSYGLVKAPDSSVARQILDFVREHSARANLVIQCEKGIGRSLAAAAALLRLEGKDNTPMLQRGTHNRKLYKLLCEAGGKPLDPEPLVSIVVRVKYSPDRFLAFLLCMCVQRHENWELIAVTDGPDPHFVQTIDQAMPRQAKDRVVILETPEAKGHWGHPYRQLGIDAAKGEFIGLSNDDNYYCPGYIEQMVNALGTDADLAICNTLHNYFGWGIASPTAKAPGDLGSFLARRSIVDQVKFTGIDWLADGRYIQTLRRIARKEVLVPKCLFVHN